MPAVHCPGCDSVNIRRHCDRPAPDAKVSNGSHTCDLLECQDCHATWHISSRHPHWVHVPPHTETA